MKLRYILLPVLLLMGQPAPANAADDSVLAVKPLNHDKNGYFEAVLKPGESTDLTLRIATSAESHLTSRISSAAPRINGGFSISDAAVIPSATWFSYEPQEFDLLGEREENYTVTVPLDTAPGEYASGVVVETEYIDTGTTFSNRTQQTVPVNIVVEGEAKPSFSFGSGSHKFKASKSSVLFEVTNDGNRHVSPAGPVEVRDSKGNTVSKAELTMASVYTGTTGIAEVMLGDALLPGDYVAVPTFKDAKSEASNTAEIPFTVEGSPEVGDEKNLPDVVQEQGGWMLPVIAGLLVLLILLVIILLVRHRKK